MKNKLQQFIALPAAILKKLTNIELALGRIESRQNSCIDSQNINDYEFKVSSQWGEDGIIQHLVKSIEIKNKVFKYISNPEDCIGSVFLTPKDMNEQFYFPEGNIDHMMLTEGQNFDKRTFSKIDGSFYSYGNMKDIFYCGAGSYPCGSVAGTAGYMCFKNIINN